MGINLCNLHGYVVALASIYFLLDAFRIRLLYCTTIFRLCSFKFISSFIPS